MNISTIISTYNSERTILLCLDSLARQTRLPDEIIIVDNNSSDNTTEVVREFIKKNQLIRITLIKEYIKGRAVARNKGVSIAKGDIIVFTDSDCVVKKNWIENILKTFNEEDNLDILSGKIYSYYPKTLVGKFLSGFWSPDMNKINKHQLNYKSELFRNKYIMLGNVAFKKKALTELTGFNESFYPGGEDIDIGMRALEKGAKIVVWDSNIIVFHMHRNTIKGMIKQAFIYGEMLAHIVKCHFSKKIIIRLSSSKIIEFNGFYSVLICPNFVKGISVLSLILILFFYSHLIVIFLLISLLVYLSVIVKVRIENSGIKILFLEILGGVFLLIIREMAEEFGRIIGSFKYRVICL